MQLLWSLCNNNCDGPMQTHTLSCRSRWLASALTAAHALPIGCPSPSLSKCTYHLHVCPTWLHGHRHHANNAFSTDCCMLSQILFHRCKLGIWHHRKLMDMASLSCDLLPETTNSDAAMLTMWCVALHSPGVWGPHGTTLLTNVCHTVCLTWPHSFLHHSSTQRCLLQCAATQQPRPGRHSMMMMHKTQLHLK